jgi:hypothetical protein
VLGKDETNETAIATGEDQVDGTTTEEVGGLIHQPSSTTSILLDGIDQTTVGAMDEGTHEL